MNSYARQHFSYEFLSASMSISVDWQMLNSTNLYASCGVSSADGSVPRSVIIYTDSVGLLSHDIPAHLGSGSPVGEPAETAGARKGMAFPRILQIALDTNQALKFLPSSQLQPSLCVKGVGTRLEELHSSICGSTHFSRQEVSYHWIHILVPLDLKMPPRWKPFRFPTNRQRLLCKYPSRL